MPLEQAIQKAIEGGWDKEKIVSPMNSPSANFARAMLDPLFWQSLGKALGWRGLIVGQYLYPAPYQTHGIPEWLYHWHRFIDHLAARKPPEDFFKEL
jgi:hypothetical protein